MKMEVCNHSFSVAILGQLCSGVDENAVGACAELIFAPIDASFSDDAPIIPSGFRIIPIDSITVCVFVQIYSFGFTLQLK